MNFLNKIFSLLFGKTNSEMSADEYNKMRQKEIQRFDTLYDTSTVEGIRKIPAPEKILSKTSSKTGKPEYILQLRAGQYEKEKKFDLAIECLRKSNELKIYSSVYYSENDYLRLVELLKRCRRFDEARTEEAHIKKLFASQNQHYENRRSKQFSKSLKTFDTDLVEVSYVGACCPICGKYRGRIFSVSGKDKRFPKLPDDFHEDCGLIAFPFIYGVNEPQYCKSKDIIAYNNRPFRDTRTAEEKSNYNLMLQEQAQELQKQQDKADYDWLWEHLPEICPKSFASYRKMKNSNSAGYQKIVLVAQKVGYIIK